MKSNRRSFIGNSALGLFGILPFAGQIGFGDRIQSKSARPSSNENKVLLSYPSTDPAIIRKVVGASHARFEVVQELVSQRPELISKGHT